MLPTPPGTTPGAHVKLELERLARPLQAASQGHELGYTQDLTDNCAVAAARTIKSRVRVG